MGFAERSNRENANIWHIDNKTNKFNGEKATDLYIKMPKKHSRQRRRRGKRNNRKRDKEERGSRKKNKSMMKKEAKRKNRRKKRKRNLEYRRDAKAPTIASYIENGTLRNTQMENRNVSGIPK